MVPRNLVPGPGMIQVEIYCLLGYIGQTEVVSLHIEDMVPAELIDISKDWLAPIGAVSP